MIQQRITALNRYRLIGAAVDFAATAARLAARVEAEGHRGVLSYRFYTSAAESLGRAVVDYADADAWIGHHEIAMGWPEMAAMHDVGRLEDVVLLGPVTPAIRAWLAASRLTARVVADTGFAAGFLRDAD